VGFSSSFEEKPGKPGRQSSDIFWIKFDHNFVILAVLKLRKKCL